MENKKGIFWGSFVGAVSALIALSVISTRNPNLQAEFEKLQTENALLRAEVIMLNEKLKELENERC